MSGQLVGEILDAAEAGHLDALSCNGVQALVTIAEKAATTTRQGSVRMARIAAAIRVNRRAGGSGAGSQSTAERAVRELRTGGWIRVVKRGFNNNHGKAHAPIYEIAALPSSSVMETVDTVPVVLGDGNGMGGDSVTEGTVPVNGATVPVTQGDVLDGSTDGSIDGGSARETAPALFDPFDYPDDPPKNEPCPFDEAAAATAVPPEPPRRCPEHLDWNTARMGKVPDCPGCRDARYDYRHWQEAVVAAQAGAAVDAAANRDRVRGDIERCDECDDFGRRDDQSDCPKHRNFRQFRVS